MNGEAKIKEAGDTLTSNSEVFTIGGQILLYKGQVVTIRAINTIPAHWDNICPDIWVPEKITGFKLMELPGDWQPGTFKEFQP